MQRNVAGCAEEVCRLCHYGCQLGREAVDPQDLGKDAYEAGTRVLVETRAERVLIEGGKAAGVEARTADGHRVSVRARAVVSACGALHTPVLLSRSGITSNTLGKHLRLHPVLVIWGQFDEEVRPWEGMLASTYSDQDRTWTGSGYGVKYEHVAIPPSILLSFSPWRGGRAARRADAGPALHRRVRRAAARPRRRGGAHRPRRRADRPLQARRRDDVDHMRRGVRGAAQVIEAMGARRVYSSHSSWVAYEPGVKRRPRQLRR